MDTLRKQLILASASPRRAQLLRQAGFSFEQRPTHVPEDYPDDLPVEDIASFLAQRKARAAREFISGEEIVLAADSVVILNGTSYEKPTDHADAKRILRALSGNMHTVITGVCMLNAVKEVVFQGESRVYFKSLTDAEIEYYISTCAPFDKAGAYAIQEWIGLCKIERIEGTYANIMGLPVDMVYEALQTF